MAFPCCRALLLRPYSISFLNNIPHQLVSSQSHLIYTYKNNEAANFERKWNVDCSNAQQKCGNSFRQLSSSSNLNSEDVSSADNFNGSSRSISLKHVKNTKVDDNKTTASNVSPELYKRMNSLKVSSSFSKPSRRDANISDASYGENSPDRILTHLIGLCRTHEDLNYTLMGRSDIINPIHMAATAKSISNMGSLITPEQAKNILDKFTMSMLWRMNEQGYGTVKLEAHLSRNETRYESLEASLRDKSTFGSIFTHDNSSSTSSPTLSTPTSSHSASDSAAKPTDPNTAGFLSLSPQFLDKAIKEFFPEITDILWGYSKIRLMPNAQLWRQFYRPLLLHPNAFTSCSPGDISKTVVSLAHLKLVHEEEDVWQAAADGMMYGLSRGRIVPDATTAYWAALNNSSMIGSSKKSTISKEENAPSNDVSRVTPGKVFGLPSPEEMNDVYEAYDGRTLSSSVFGFATAKVAPSEELLSLFLMRTKEIAPRCNSTDLTNLIWGFHYLGLQDNGIFHFLTDYVRRNVTGFRPKELASVLTVFCQRKVVDGAMIEAMTKAVSHSVAGMPTAHLLDTLTSFHTLYDEQVLLEKAQRSRQTASDVLRAISAREGERREAPAEAKDKKESGSAAATDTTATTVATPATTPVLTGQRKALLKSLSTKVAAGAQFLTASQLLRAATVAADSKMMDGRFYEHILISARSKMETFTPCTAAELITTCLRGSDMCPPVPDSYYANYGANTKGSLRDNVGSSYGSNPLSGNDSNPLNPANEETTAVTTTPHTTDTSSVTSPVTPRSLIPPPFRVNSLVPATESAPFPWAQLTIFTREIVAQAVAGSHTEKASKALTAAAMSNAKLIGKEEDPVTIIRRAKADAIAQSQLGESNGLRYSNIRKDARAAQDALNAMALSESGKANKKPGNESEEVETSAADHAFNEGNLASIFPAGGAATCTVSRPLSYLEWVTLLRAAFRVPGAMEKTRVSSYAMDAIIRKTERMRHRLETGGLSAEERALVAKAASTSASLEEGARPSSRRTADRNMDMVRKQVELRRKAREDMVTEQNVASLAGLLRLMTQYGHVRVDALSEIIAMLVQMAAWMPPSGLPLSPTAAVQLSASLGVLVPTIRHAAEVMALREKRWSNPALRAVLLKGDGGEGGKGGKEGSTAWRKQALAQSRDKRAAETYASLLFTTQWLIKKLLTPILPDHAPSPDRLLAEANAGSYDDPSSPSSSSTTTSSSSFPHPLLEKMPPLIISVLSTSLACLSALPPNAHQGGDSTFLRRTFSSSFEALGAAINLPPKEYSSRLGGKVGVLKADHFAALAQIDEALKNQLLLQRFVRQHQLTALLAANEGNDTTAAYRERQQQVTKWEEAKVKIEKERKLVAELMGLPRLPEPSPTFPMQEAPELPLKLQQRSESVVRSHPQVVQSALDTMLVPQYKRRNLASRESQCSPGEMDGSSVTSLLAAGDRNNALMTALMDEPMHEDERRQIVDEIQACLLRHLQPYNVTEKILNSRSISKVLNHEDSSSSHSTDPMAGTLGERRGWKVLVGARGVEEEREDDEVILRHVGKVEGALRLRHLNPLLVHEQEGSMEEGEKAGTESNNNDANDVQSVRSSDTLSPETLVSSFSADLIVNLDLVDEDDEIFDSSLASLLPPSSSPTSTPASTDDKIPSRSRSLSRAALLIDVLGPQHLVLPRDKEGLLPLKNNAHTVEQIDDIQNVLDGHRSALRRGLAAEQFDNNSNSNNNNGNGNSNSKKYFQNKGTKNKPFKNANEHDNNDVLPEQKVLMLAKRDATATVWGGRSLKELFLAKQGLPVCRVHASVWRALGIMGEGSVGPNGPSQEEVEAARWRYLQGVVDAGITQLDEIRAGLKN